MPLAPRAFTVDAAGWPWDAFPVKAVVIPRFGGPEVLEIVDLPAPRPGPGEVRVRVAAAVVNPVDAAMRTGGFGDGLAALPRIPGMELAGTVDAVGEGVTSVQIGARVMGIVMPFRPEGGAQAEQVVLPADSVAPVPAGASFAEAATLPMNGLTVRLALDLLALPAGATLGVTGSAGAVGGYAIQLGKVAGLRVLADAQPSDEALIRSLGADLLVSRGPRVAAAMRAAVPEGLDGLIDAAVQEATVLPALRDGGAYAALRGFAGKSERGIRILPVMVREYVRNRAALEELGRLAAAGRVTLRVAEALPVERIADAHRRVEGGGVRGRIVVLF